MNKYRVEVSDGFKKDFKKLDKNTQKLIHNWIDKNLVETLDPRSYGKALNSDRKGQWRYRIGDNRLICIIQDDKLVILALAVGHRKDIYVKHK